MELHPSDRVIPASTLSHSVKDLRSRLGLGLVALGVLGFGLYGWRELRRQTVEIQRLAAAASAVNSAPGAAKPSTVYLIANSERDDAPAAASAAPAASTKDDGSNRPSDKEPTDAERRAIAQARIDRMYHEFREQPVDGKATTAQRSIQTGVDAALARTGDFRIKRGPIDCRLRWCSMSIRYTPDSNLDDFDETVRSVLYEMDATRGPPAISRLTKEAADGKGREGMYFFRWKEEYW